MWLRQRIKYPSSSKSEPPKMCIRDRENAQNPLVAKTEKSPQSEPISEQPKKSAEGATLTKDEKPSVREELRKIKESRKEQEADTPSSLDKSSASDRAKMCIRDSYCLNLCGKAKYKVELGSDPLGNLTRIENELAKLPARLERCV